MTLVQFLSKGSKLGFYVRASPSCVDNATRAKILQLDGFFVIYSYSRSPKSS